MPIRLLGAVARVGIDSPRRRTALLCLALLGPVVLLQPTHMQAAVAQDSTADALKYFHAYFLTGGHVAAGVDLSPQKAVAGAVTGEIVVEDDPTLEGVETVPADADVVAAFLHFELITTSQDMNPLAKASFRGHPIGDIAKPIGSATLDPTAAPCFSSGGGSNAVYTMTAYRVDVLRFLPVPEGGKRLVNASDLKAQNDPVK